MHLLKISLSYPQLRSSPPWMSEDSFSLWVSVFAKGHRYTYDIYKLSVHMSTVSWVTSQMQPRAAQLASEAPL